MLRNENFKNAIPVMTIYGQVVIDHAVSVQLAHESADLFGKGIIWDEEGAVTIEHGVKISVPCIIPPKAERTLFSLPEGKFKTGNKIDAEKVKVVPWKDVADGEIRFGFDRQLPGGGAMNIAFGLYNVFRGIPVSLVSIYSNEEDTMLEDALRPLFVSGGLKLLKVDPYPSVNVILEGIKKDRIIIRSPRVRDIAVEYQKAVGDFVMVNSVYSREFAMNALLECMKASQGGIIACTASLCHHDDLFNDAEAEKFTALLQEQLGTTESLTANKDSIYTVIKDIMMPSSDKITYIFNEDELDHFISLINNEFDVMYRGKRTGALFSGVLRALQTLRDVQKGKMPPIVVTLGADGALYLDNENGLHYCSVITDQQMGRKSYGEKKAIGDLFAAVITAIAYGRGDRGVVQIRGSDSKIKKSKESSAPSILLTASATADIGVYDGFMQVRPSAINEILTKKVALGHYMYLGILNEVKKVSAMFSDINMEDFRKGTISEADTCSLENLVEAGLVLPSLEIN